MRVAVIPARGGSKRIPGKNIKLFCGKPIIAWSIETAIKSNCFDLILVSTDDEIIAEIGRKFGAEIPFIRPASLSDDFTATSSVIAHAIGWLKSQEKTIDLVCCIYATAPFVRSEDLRKGLEMIEKEQSDFCFPITSYPYPIQRAIKITMDGRCEMLQPKMYHIRSQDLEVAYHDAAQFYWGRTNAWLNETPIFSHHSVGIKLPRERVQDIDTLEDWNVAEYIFNNLKRDI